MIRLHNLSMAEPSTSAAGSNNSSTAASPSNLDNFETALQDALASTFQKFGIDPNSVKISITPESSRAPANPTTAASTNTSASAAVNAGYDPFLQAASQNSEAPATNVVSAALSASTASSGPTPDPIQSFDDSYWAKQPAAIQQLRNITDPEKRAEAAHALAIKGYSIDVPIMVWGWDPSITTSLRQSFGYTWVPSGLQNPVQTAPGLPALAGMKAYDANNPPPGSIMV